MLSKEIVIKSEAAAVKLYGYLFKKPFYGNHIKHLKFDFKIQSIPLMKELLRAVFTPTLITFDGVIETDEFYLCINSIAANSSVPFANLKRVPHPSFTTPPYVDTLLTFRYSLEEIVLDVGDESPYEGGKVLTCLSQLPCLTNINFNGMFDSMFDLERYLIGCPQLQQLTLNGYDSNFEDDPIDIEQWKTQKVVKANALKRLTIKHYCAIEMLKYLLFKFTNVEIIALKLTIPSDNIQNDNDIESAMNALKQPNIKQIYLDLTLDGKEFKDVLRYLVNNGASYTITEVNDTSVHISIIHF